MSLSPMPATRLRNWPIAALCLGLLMLPACGPQPSPEIETRLVYPTLPPTQCARKPVPPALDASDNEWAAYKFADSQAGDDCRDKLDEVHRVQSKWPRATDQTPQ